MKLVKAEIVNFRSIRNITISFDPKCLVLVGINESGKSNILQALALLSRNAKFDDYDIRQVHPEEGYPDDSHVEFYFEFDKEELDKLIKNFSDKTIVEPDSNIVLDNGKPISVIELCKQYARGTLLVDVLNKKSTFRHYSFENTFSVANDIVLTTKSASTYSVKTKRGEEYELDPDMILNLSDIETKLSQDLYHPLTLDELNDSLGEEIRIIMENKRPDAIIWKYSESNLLPDKIDMTQFTLNPDTCSVLHNMFKLAGITEITKEIQNAQKRGQTGIRNMLNRVATISTQHLRDVWKDYKSVKFELQQNGNHIDASIRDEHNNFPMKFRSDGFKQFGSFLLMISARVKKGELENTLLLIDEPGVTLHPSGCQDLRDELINISKKNLVVYSTHSIFMIDKEKLDRHIIVKKKEEITFIEVVNQSNIKDEEVVYNALGHSIFADLKKQNIVFEGWRDKHLFEVAYGRVPRNYNEIKDFFRDFGLCYVQGVKQIDFFTPLLALADRNCIIVTDSDTISKEKKRDHTENKDFGTWYTYDDLIAGVCVTAEAFVKVNIVKDCLDQIQQRESFQTNIAEQDLQNSTRGKLYVISQWFVENGVTQERQKVLFNELKEHIFTNLAPSQIEDKYYQMLMELKRRITT